VIELVSGLQGTSLGTAVTFDGISESGQVFYRNANVQGLPAGDGLIGDAAPGSVDLVASRFALLDLEASGDTAGGADGTSSDNITSARSFTLRSRLLPNQTVELLDNGVAVSSGTATADSQGFVSWSLNAVDVGTHRYSLLDHIEQIPVVMSGRPTAASLEVTVRDSGASMLLASSLSADPLTNANLESGIGPSVAKSQGSADSMTAYSPLLAPATGPSAVAGVSDRQVVPGIPTAGLFPSLSPSPLFPDGEPDPGCLDLCGHLHGELLA
jgi:hypothetical protein